MALLAAVAAASASRRNHLNWTTSCESGGTCSPEALGGASAGAVASPLMAAATDASTAVVASSPPAVVSRTARELRDAVLLRAEVCRRFANLFARSAVAIADYRYFYHVHGGSDGGHADSPTPDGAEAEAEADDVLRHHGDGELYRKEMSGVHRRAASSMYEACASHGGLLIKLGQYVSNMRGVVPAEYAEALSPLQDSCAPLPADEVRRAMAAEVRRCGYGDVSEVFRDVDYDEPLGSASLAQVHSATLAGDGRRVAVKVQRPTLEASVAADLVALELLDRAVEKFFPGTGFAWMLPEFHQTIAAELDFTQEATNMERAKRMLHGRPLAPDASTYIADLFRFGRRWRGGTRLILDENGDVEATSATSGAVRAVVPTPVKELTTTKMLTMSHEEGFKVTDRERLRMHGIDPTRVASATCAMFAELIHVHGFVHSDPHPGNLLVRPRGMGGRGGAGGAAGGGPGAGEFDLVLLDHGMYRRLDETFRRNYSELWAGLVAGDDARARRGVAGLGLPESYVDFLGMMLVYKIPSGLLDSSLKGRMKLGITLDKKSQKAMGIRLKEKFGEDMFTASSANQFMESLPRDLLFCLRCSNLVRGINRELGGTSVGRFVAFGTAASRGARLTAPNGSLAANNVDSLASCSGPLDAITHAKKSLNVPVASELVAHEKVGMMADRLTRNGQGQQLFIAPHTLTDMLHTLNISMRVWGRSILADLLVWLSGDKILFNPTQLG